MNCPKCGAVNQQGRDECSACGVVFARWRPREPKPPVEVIPPPREPGTSARSQINFWVAVPVAATVVFFGLLFASSGRRSEPAGAGTQTVQAAAGGAPASGEASVSGSADSISDDEIQRLIEECDFFQERLVVRIPKSVSPGTIGLIDDHGALALAANMGIVELDPPFDVSMARRHLPNPANPGGPSEVRLGRNASGVPITDMGSEFQIDLGRRRVESLSGIQRTAGKVGLFYRWTVENPSVLNFAPDQFHRYGGADIRWSGGRWAAKGVWLNTDSGARMLCSNE
jgi:hypothetical protein